MARDKGPDKRQRILDAALKVFAQRGFYNAKVSEIAKRAGVADGTIYLYFANKDDVLIQLFEDRMEYIISRLTQDLAKSQGNPLDRIRSLIHLHVDLATHDPDLAEFITVELRQSGTFIREYENPQFIEYLRILRDIIEEGQRDGYIRPSLDSRLIVRAIFGAIDEVLLTLTLASRSRSVDIRLSADQLADLLLDGMATPASKDASATSTPSKAARSS